MTIPVKSPSALVAEYRDIVHEKGPILMAMVEGALWGLNTQANLSGIKVPTDIAWILYAHKGTLEKLSVLLPEDRLPSSLELVAAARAIFENLVWLRLFQRDSEWGNHFYGRLLKDQLDDLRGLITKIEEEIDLFRAFDEENDRMAEQWINDLDLPNNPGQDAILLAKAKHDERVARLDLKARRTFSLYAAQAVFNGYGYQVHILENRELPRVRAELDKTQLLIDEFKAEIGNEEKIKTYFSAFNWSNNAQAVGMKPQYDYLYRLTSRLLHSGPMSIVTEKDLTRGEQTVLLEYIVIAAIDILELVNDFDFPGRFPVALINLEDD